MSNLLTLPTELLNRILSTLPVPSLLSFSSTGQQARTLANSNLHDLSLGIQPLCSYTASRTPYDIWLRIPDAHTYSYLTLLNFQSALVNSILARHGLMLQHLELSVWALTVPIAEAIAHLGALRSLSIRIESGVYRRGLSRSCRSLEREEQHKAWELLSKKAVWRSRLTALRIEDADLGTEQLAILLGDSRCCRELWLNRCRFIGKEVWEWLRSEWHGRDKLKILDVCDCGGVLGDAAIDAVGKMKGLQYLNLYDCQTLDNSIFEQHNRDLWRIPEFTPPRSISNGEDTIIEVDPEYT